MLEYLDFNGSNEMPRKKNKYNDPAIEVLNHFKGARDFSSPKERLSEVRKRCLKFREFMLSHPQVKFYKSFDLIRVPYPSKYAFLNAYSALNKISPMIHIMNRLFVIQVNSDDGIKTILVSPSDAIANAQTPFFKRLEGGFGPFKNLGKKIVAPEIATVESSLKSIGLKPKDIDYITYDHLHTQDLRKWLNSKSSKGFFPNAKLLIMKKEWDLTKGLLPTQRDWYCPDGLEGIDPNAVIKLEDDVMIGQGLALLSTPGHTEGNHSIVAHSPEGLLVTSENGVAPEVYSPMFSEIPGIRKFAQDCEIEIIMNGNTLDNSVDQYISMVMEKDIAGPSKRNSAFPNMLCSSEFTEYWAFPGLKPTFNFGAVEFGNLTRV